MIEFSDDDDDLFAYARSTDPDTSHEAAATMPDAGRMEQIIWQHMMKWPDRKWIQGDFYALFPEKAEHSVTPRFASMESKGKILKTGEKRRSERNRECNVYIPLPLPWTPPPPPLELSKLDQIKLAFAALTQADQTEFNRHINAGPLKDPVEQLDEMDELSKIASHEWGTCHRCEEGLDIEPTEDGDQSTPV